MTVAERKRELRREISEAARMLPEDYLRKAGEGLCEMLLSLPEYQTAETVFAFASTDKEPDIWPFLAQTLRDGKRLALPVCTAPGVMECRAVVDLGQLRPGRYGIPEPREGSPLVLPNDIDLAVVPCVTCDREGHRLGHGGGYYDRFLAAYQGAAVCVCPETLLRESVPAEPWDIAVPMVATEKKIYRIGPVNAENFGH